MKSTPAQTAAKIKKELKQKFPTVKFAVRSRSFSMGDSVDIDWTDGPTIRAVEEIVGRYEYGSFNSQEDMYEYDNVIEGLPQVKYVQTQRSMSAETRQAVLEITGVDAYEAYAMIKDLDLTDRTFAQAWEEKQEKARQEWREWEEKQKQQQPAQTAAHAEWQQKIERLKKIKPVISRPKNEITLDIAFVGEKDDSLSIYDENRKNQSDVVVQKFHVAGIATMSQEDFTLFTNNLMMDYLWLAGWGQNWKDKVSGEWHVENLIVMNQATGEWIAVDTFGYYTYARRVGRKATSEEIKKLQKV